VSNLVRTLDILLSAGPSSGTAASNAVASFYAQIASVSAVASVAGCTVREAAALAAPHVVLFLASSHGLTQDIRTALALKNPARDVGGRRLRAHILLDSTRAESVDLLDEVARELRGRRIFVWTGSRGKVEQAENAIERHRLKILGRIETSSDWQPTGGPDLTNLHDLLATDAAEGAVADHPNEGHRQSAPAAESVDRKPSTTSPRASAAPPANSRDQVLEEMLNGISSRLSADLHQALTTFEAHILESAEHRFATRLDGLATAWVGYVRSSVVDATSRFIERTNAAFGARAEHFTQRIEAHGVDELRRTKQAAEAARRETTAVIREWVEPMLGLRGRWFGIGVVTCAACLAVGLVAGSMAARVLGWA
jgi:hypothetical protein